MPYQIDTIIKFSKVADRIQASSDHSYFAEGDRSNANLATDHLLARMMANTFYKDTPLLLIYKLGI